MGKLESFNYTNTRGEPAGRSKKLYIHPSRAPGTNGSGLKAMYIFRSRPACLRYFLAFFLNTGQQQGDQKIFGSIRPTAFQCGQTNNQGIIKPNTIMQAQGKPIAELFLAFSPTSLFELPAAQSSAGRVASWSSQTVRSLNGSLSTRTRSDSSYPGPRAQSHVRVPPSFRRLEWAPGPASPGFLGWPCLMVLVGMGAHWRHQANQRRFAGRRSRNSPGMLSAGRPGCDSATVIKLAMVLPRGWRPWPFGALAFVGVGVMRRPRFLLVIGALAPWGRPLSPQEQLQVTTALHPGGLIPYLASWPLAIGWPTATFLHIHLYAVEVQHLLTKAQSASTDTLAQAAPGPNAMYVTFRGRHLAGWKGVAATTIPSRLVPATPLTNRLVRPLEPACQSLTPGSAAQSAVA